MMMIKIMIMMVTVMIIMIMMLRYQILESSKKIAIVSAAKSN